LWVEYGAVRALVLSGLTLLSSCDGLTTGVKAPEGLACARIKAAGPNLAAALNAAAAGDCVIAPEGTWVGSFTVPSDVSLAASEGERVVLKGDGSDNPVLRVMGGTRSNVRNVIIETSGGGGIAIDPGPANLVGVSISGTSRDALSATCTRGDCQGESVLQDSELFASASGVVVSKVALRIEGGRIAGMSGAGLADGSGVVAFDGAQLAMKSVLVEDNQAIGVLIDGADTRASLTDCAVKNNGGRGVWIQRATGGSVSISGGEVSGNALVGIGARDTANLTVSGTSVLNTRSVRVQVDLSTQEDIGDGVGLFSGVSNTVVENVVSRGNARAQILADGIGAQVAVRTPDVGGGLYRVVAQRSSFTLEAPTAVVDNPGKALHVEATAQSIP
jgi:Right handed beta helix region